MAASRPPNASVRGSETALTTPHFPGTQFQPSMFTRCWVFDFDWTVVDENSDTWIHRCAPGGSLPPAVRDSYVPPDWIGYMNHVLGHLAEQGVTADDLRKELQAIPWTPGMRQLLEAIADSGNHPLDTVPSSASAADAGPASSSPSCSAAADPAAAAPQPTPSATTAVAAGRDSAGRGWRSGAPPLRGTQHAIIISDANSLFIPWILDGGGGRDGGCGPGAHCLGDGTGGAGSRTTAGTSAEAVASQGSPLSGPDVANTAPTSSAGPKDAAADPAAHSTGTSPGPGPRPLTGMFLQILTNPATVDLTTGAVEVAPHNGPGPRSSAPPHSCPRCHPNLCKRSVLRRFLDEQLARGVSYRQLVYVGDGRNDLCPCLGLGSSDVAMPRVGFALHKLLGAAKPAGAASQSGQGAGQGGCSGSDVSGSSGVASQQGDDAVYAGLGGGGTAGGDGTSQHGSGRHPSGKGEVLRAACVPWHDAHDVLRWAREQDEQDVLADRAGAMAL